MEFENEKTPLPNKFEEIIFDSQQKIIEFSDKNCSSEEEIFDFMDKIGEPKKLQQISLKVQLFAIM